MKNIKKFFYIKKDQIFFPLSLSSSSSFSFSSEKTKTKTKQNKKKNPKQKPKTNHFFFQHNFLFFFSKGFRKSAFVKLERHRSAFPLRKNPPTSSATTRRSIRPIQKSIMIFTSFPFFGQFPNLEFSCFLKKGTRNESETERRGRLACTSNVFLYQEIEYRFPYMVVLFLLHFDRVRSFSDSIGIRMRFMRSIWQSDFSRIIPSTMYGRGRDERILHPLYFSKRREDKRSNREKRRQEKEKSIRREAKSRAEKRRERSRREEAKKTSRTRKEKGKEEEEARKKKPTYSHEEYSDVCLFVSCY